MFSRESSGLGVLSALLALLLVACGASEPGDGDAPGEATASSSAAGSAATAECGRAFNPTEARQYFGGRSRGPGDVDLGPVTLQGASLARFDRAELRRRQPARRPWLLIKQGILISPPIEVTLSVEGPGRGGLRLAFGGSDRLDPASEWQHGSAGTRAVRFEACERAGPDRRPASRRDTVQHVGAFLLGRPGCYLLRATGKDGSQLAARAVSFGRPAGRCGGRPKP